MNYNQKKMDPSFGKGWHAGIRKQTNPRFFIGLLLVVIGLVLIADNFGWIPYDASRIIISWQMLLIVLGLFNFARKAYAPAFFLTAIGLFFMAPKIMDVPRDFMANFWPALLVVVGVSFILRRGRHWGCSHEHGLSRTEFFDEVAVFGGRETNVVTESLKGGRVTSIFGGSTINLLKANPSADCIIDVISIFGGSKFIVPEEWNVKLEVASIFGGFADKRGPSVVGRTDPEKVVVFKGYTIFGGGDIVSLP